MRRGIEPLRTLTHARLRAEQGDLRAAREILREILSVEPDHSGALNLLDELASRSGTPAAERAEPAIEPRRAAEPSELAGRFRQALGTGPDARERIRRLEEWLRRVERVGG